MSDRTDTLTNLIKPYGLPKEEGRIYVHLLKNGFLTALELSRQLHMGRTKVYRSLDKLKEKQLVEYQVHTRGMKFGATHPNKLKQIIKEKEQKVQSLQQSLPDLVSQLTSLLPDSQQEGRVLYYEGKDGLEQVSYNITRAQDELRVFEMEHLDDFLDFDFSEQIRVELVEKQIFTRDLTNKKSFSGFTDVKELIKKYSQYRYISPDKMEVRFETLIYNDVYATYNYHDGNIFCVEIYNPQLAQMQKQLFDFIWEQAVPMKFVDDRGGARVEG